MAPIAATARSGSTASSLPEQDAVVAITSGVKNMQAVLDLVWDKLLPAFKPATLATDEESHQKLARTLAGLSLRPVAGSASPAKVSGKRFTFPANGAKLEAISLESDDQGDTLVVRVAGTDQRIACGHGAVEEGAFGLRHAAGATRGRQRRLDRGRHVTRPRSASPRPRFSSRSS